MIDCEKWKLRETSRGQKSTLVYLSFTISGINTSFLSLTPALAQQIKILNN